MANEHHLDRELMILFLESGIWHDYALSYLQADKIDTVDIPALLRKLEIPDCQPTKLIPNSFAALTPALSQRERGQTCPQINIRA
ncbi:Uncharacterised protein [Serratia fonticola]|uniref:Uncharacterized protein n=1 Tax=Serratia fonticola TaxID=47917 RepID=A0A4U9W460_SERFO|nr:Uncharacterised protein [Serratia fonticola]